MPSKMKWLNIYRKFSKDILLQNLVSQPGFNFYSNMKYQSPKNVLQSSVDAEFAQGQKLAVW